ncbi:MAG: NAD(P)-dependent oxidoreductase, partial [Acholeplasmataceae bacterium]
MKIYLETTFMEKQLYQPIINRYPQFEFTFNKDEDCEILIGVFFDRDEIYFDHFKNLKWIMLFVAGFDHLDLAYLKKRQIMLTNGQTVYDIQIAEDVVAKMLFLNRQMGIYHDQMKTHVWKHQAPHYELYQQQVLILGAGSIGQLIAKRLKAFEMEIIGYKRTYENLDNFDAIITKKDELIKYYRSCDYLIVCLPLTKQTKNFIDKKVFDLLKPTALLINIARG